MKTRKKRIKPTTLEIGKPVAAETVKMKETARSSELYIPVYEALKSLAIGKVLPITVAKGVTAKQMHNRVSTALDRMDLAAITPAKHKLSYRTAADETALYLKWTEGKRRAKGK